MMVHGVTPILNVSDMDASFAWFAKLGWKELWRWGDPTGFGAVGSGPCEIFMCRGGQGGRGKGDNTSTFATFEDETQDKGCWMSWWVEDVDAVVKQAVDAGATVTMEVADQFSKRGEAIENELERAGYLERVPDPTDARARLIRVAERGARVVALAAEEVEKVEAEWAEHLGAEDTIALRRALAKLRTITDPYV